MKKIGLLTFHASHNNGSMLQTLALLNVLRERYKLNVEIIDFSNKEQRHMYATIPTPRNWRQIVKDIFLCTNYFQLKKQFESFEKFKNNYFVLSENEYYTDAQLEDIEKEYDAFIVGSDQIWNVKCRDADDAYYLSFVHSKKRYAYAVSFGANNPFTIGKEDERKKYMSLVNIFNTVSVREPNGQKWIYQATGRNVPVCLDPTMLYDMKEWEDIVNIGERIIKEDYIFYYCFEIREDIEKFLKGVSRRAHLPVYFMDAREWTLKMCWKNGIKLIRHYGPAVYMNAVKYSSIFITTSFHGTAFAIIYRKCFWYINDIAYKTPSDDRATSFLTQMGLLERYKTMEELNQINLFCDTRFDNVDEKIESLRKISYEYLDSISEDIMKTT